MIQTIKNFVIKLQIILIRFLEYFRLIQTLPIGYTSKNYLILILLLLGLLSSYLLGSELIYSLEHFKYFKLGLIFVLTFSILNVTFLKFNLIIKIFYFLIKGIPYFFKLIKSNREGTIFYKLFFIK